MKKIISRDYGIKLLNSGRAVYRGTVRDSDNGRMYTCIDDLQRQRTMHFCALINDDRKTAKEAQG
jgi:hypothetical protein